MEPEGLGEAGSGEGVTERAADEDRFEECRAHPPSRASVSVPDGVAGFFDTADVCPLLTQLTGLRPLASDGDTAGLRVGLQYRRISFPWISACDRSPASPGPVRAALPAQIGADQPGRNCKSFYKIE
jgi:hypothetical protein